MAQKSMPIYGHIQPEIKLKKKVLREIKLTEK